VLNVKPGDFCPVGYTSKYGNSKSFASFKITRTFKSSEQIPSNVLFVNDLDFYKAVYADWPQSSQDPKNFQINQGHPLYSFVSPEWTLLPRSKSTQELAKLMKDVAKQKYKGTVMDVRTMYESASAVLQLESALNLITFVAVVLLYLIILIGVVNTLRMTVKERTREIGTVRAIGMQKKDVQFSFILETFFLALFSSLAGTILAFLTMKGFSLIKINAGGNPMGMLLVNEHLYFSPLFSNILVYIVLIVALAVFTAFFPSRKAAALSAADALRHYE
jgi:ABC-type antimicrobial peptide transport system permease subunit